MQDLAHRALKAVSRTGLANAPESPHASDVNTPHRPATAPPTPTQQSPKQRTSNDVIGESVALSEPSPMPTCASYPIEASRESSVVAAPAQVAVPRDADSALARAAKVPLESDPHTTRGPRSFLPDTQPSMDTWLPSNMSNTVSSNNTNAARDPHPISLNANVTDGVSNQTTPRHVPSVIERDEALPDDPSPSKAQRVLRAIRCVCQGAGPMDSAAAAEGTDGERPPESNIGSIPQSPGPSTATSHIAPPPSPPLSRASVASTPAPPPEACADNGSSGRPDPSESGSTKNVQKTISRHQALRALFDLPEDAQYFTNFHCALRSSILVQGRLYIFDRWFCFHSNIFGIETKRRICVDDVDSIRKHTHLGLSNRILLTDKYGKRYVFASFFNRNEALAMMERLLKTRRLTEAQASPEQSDIDDETASCVDADDDDEDLNWPIQRGVAPPSCPEAEQWLPVLDLELPHVSLTAFSHIFDRDPTFLMKWHNLQKQTNVDYGQWNNDPEMGRVRQVRFIAQLTEGGPLAPKSAECVQVQRGTLYFWNGQAVFVLQVEQTSPKIPYGEHFQVHTCWRITNSKGSLVEPGVRVTIDVRVFFTKKTTFESIIRNKTQDRFKNAVGLLSKMLQEHFAAPPAPERPPSGREKGGVEDVVRAVLQKTHPQMWRDEMTQYLKTGGSMSAQPQSRSALSALLPDGTQSWALLAAVAVIVFICALLLERFHPSHASHPSPAVLDLSRMRVRERDGCMCFCPEG